MISVIVPVYKVEKYLDKCVQSILAQTYRDFELILVDDGSPDNCPEMCDKYEVNDPRVRVLHKINGGLSDARNAGTSLAKGKWITYIDSDDYVSENYLETLITLAEKYDAQIAVVGIEVLFEGDSPKNNKHNKEYIYTGVKALEKMLYQDTLDTSACAMLLQIDIAKKNPFPFGKYHEDEFTTYKYYVMANKVAVTTKKQYFYLQRKGSITHVFGQSSIDELDAADELVEFCRSNYPTLVKAAESKKFSDYCQVLLSNENIKYERYDFFQKISLYLNNKKLQILCDRCCRKKNRVAALVLLCGLDALYIVNKVIQKVRNGES